jgi:hypothetical protein
MSTQEQAFINGFVKRAMEYGFDQNEAIHLLKQANPNVAQPVKQPVRKPVQPLKVYEPTPDQRIKESVNAMLASGWDTTKQVYNAGAAKAREGLSWLGDKLTPQHPPMLDDFRKAQYINAGRAATGQGTIEPALYNSSMPLNTAAPSTPLR